MHILLISSGRIFGLPSGGEDLNTILLGRWLAEHGHDVTLMGIEYAGLKVRHLSHRTAEHLLNAKSKDRRKKRNAGLLIRYFSYSFRTVIWLMQVLKILLINIKSPVTIIHSQDSGYTGLASVVAGKVLDIPIIITLHGLRYKEIESNPFINKMFKRLVLKIEYELDKITLNNANRITLVNPLMMNYLNQFSNAAKFATVIPNSIILGNFEFSQLGRNRIRGELGVGNDDLLLGYVGRFSPEKNLVILLDAFAQAILNNNALRLILVGEGPLENQLQCRVTDLNIRSRVIFSGFRSDIGDILSSLDIFVHPSLMEGFSIGILEAMACGRAILCSNIPENRQLITNFKNGLLVDPKNREAIESLILLLSKDDILRQEIGHNAKITSSQFDSDLIFFRFLEQYQNLVRVDRK